MSAVLDPRIDQIAPVVAAGGWVDIGYDSAIKLEGGKILHRVSGVVKPRKLSWLVDELPLLNWILKNS